MISNIMNHFAPFEKINSAFHMTLLLSLSTVALAFAVVHWSMGNDNCVVPVRFIDTYESCNNSDDDENADYTEVRFSEYHCKDSECAHE